MIQKSETHELDDPLAVIMQPEEEKIGIIGVKQKLPNLDTEKPYPEISSSIGPSKSQQQGGNDQKIRCKVLQN